MAPRPHKETCILRMEKHLEKEENPRWKRAADAQEEKFWEARQEEEDKMEADKVDEKVDEPKVDQEANASKVDAEQTNFDHRCNVPVTPRGDRHGTSLETGV